MDFANSTRTAENRTKWKEIVAKPSVVSQPPLKVMVQNRIELNYPKDIDKAQPPVISGY